MRVRHGISLCDLMLGATMVLALVGCQATPSSNADQPTEKASDTSSGLIGPSGEPLPRLDALQASAPRRRVPVFGPGATAAAVITRIWLPADDTLNQLWHLGSTATLSNAELQAWHENQLRATLIQGKQLKKFTRQLPAPYGVNQQVLTFLSHFVPLDPASPLASRQPAMVTIENKTTRYVNGRMELMAAATLQHDDQIKLTIIPHQYVPKPSILPRNPVQAAMDGPLFTKLMLRVLLKPGDVLLIAPDLPTPHFDDTRPTADEAGASAGGHGVSSADQSAGSHRAAAGKGNPQRQKNQPHKTNKEKAGHKDDKSHLPQREPAQQTLKHAPAASQPAPRLNGLGRAILTGRQNHTAMYQMWMIQVQPLKPAASEQTHPLPDAQPTPPNH